MGATDEHGGVDMVDDQEGYVERLDSTENGATPPSLIRLAENTGSGFFCSLAGFRE